ncbi:hypothetical protein U8C35_17110 [Sinorhizobium medicae]|uniref:hypothetical protein n=1 Tax=Sinorhizobium medicae TaxID=110321 RepID=UPI002AF6CA3C|nr:hypothetical protein [Sinorhizobium medicae]WQO58342.1 hypothetical protein U8C35_17110 [Sinorhizobium medicae]
MAKFLVPIDEQGNPFSLFSRGLNRKKINIGHTEDALHPCRAIITGAAKFERSFKSFVRELQRSDLYILDDEGSDSSVLTAFEDLCYCATELFDVYAQAIPAAINLRPDRSFRDAEQQYPEIAKKRRSDWSLVCNKIKHNHNVLVPLRQHSLKTGEVVRGYVLCKPVGADGLTLNADLHKAPERSRTFDSSANQMIYDIFRCDLAASEILGKLPENNDQAVVAPEVKFHIGESLRGGESR